MADDAPEEENERRELTPEERERREHAFGFITQLGDPVLKTRAVEIKEFGGDLVSLAAHMVAIMDDAIGVGLAAPQIGRPIRMFVYREDGDGEAKAIVNPVLEVTNPETESMDEGCLSIGTAKVHVPVDRPIGIRMTGQTVDGKPVDVEYEGYNARVVQHETDHLDGVLMLDRTTPEARRAALKELHALRSGDELEPDPA